MADEIEYEFKTVRTVRGAEGLTISKMRNDGWELTGQNQGMLRSSLDFRRPKKRESWLMAGAGVAVLAVIAAVGGLIAVFSDDGDRTEAVQQPDRTVATASAPQKTPSAPATQAVTATGGTNATGSAKAPGGTTVTGSAKATKVITPKNNPEFAALMKEPDYCDTANSTFASGHQGQTVAFNGSIADLAPYRDYETRFDLLLRPGDKGSEATVGPAFKYENVSIRDLNLTGKKIPARVREGDTFRFTAEIREFNTVQCLFYLDPVSTQVR
ncbi:DUF4839 domain-containing protein [Actinoplanes couchii]|nr:DUF4839 domain-containing protein [Actinoplanes couchii]MDR6320629.1 hypothetical protein [Actinoplanes couchii]